MMPGSGDGSHGMPIKNMEQGRGPEDGDNSRDISRDSGKRKYGEREPESPGHIEPDVHSAPHAKKERSSFFGDVDTDSAASYPKHVIVPAPDMGHDDKLIPHSSHLQDDHNHHMPHPSYPPDHSGHGAQVLTPDSVGRTRPPSYEGHASYHHHQPASYHDVYRAPSYTPEMDYGRPYGGSSSQYASAPPPASNPRSDNYARPRRWACDYCNVATFLSYEEACAHEEACSRRQYEPYPHDPRQQARPVPPAYGGPPPPAHHHQQQGSGLGVLYQAGQEVVTPPTPHRHQPSRWASHAPPLPVLPHEQGYYREGYYNDTREQPAPANYHTDPHYHPPPPTPHHRPPHHPTAAAPPPPSSQQQQHHHQQHPYHAGGPPPTHHQHQHHHRNHHDYYQKRMLLATSADRDSLSDRQCFVRSEMVEIFAATQKDVSARHSKGAQKLVVGQVGIRCVHCSHLRPRDRAERAVCYPSSISRIYQTVADMQRFHFEHCREIPDHVRQLYKKLKTTRPRGVGSPQTYWVSSAKGLSLVDSEEGIRFASDLAKEQQQQHQRSEGSEMSIGN